MRFESQFPEPLRCWIVQAPKTWPGPEGWWLDIAREELVEGPPGPGDGAERALGPVDVRELSDVTYLPPVGPVANWWRQELRGRLTEVEAEPIVQFLPGEEIEAGGGVPVVDLTPALLPLRLRQLEEVPPGVHCCWPLIPGLTTSEETCKRGLETLAGAGVAGVQPMAPRLSAVARRALGEMTDRRGYQQLFHDAPPDVCAFASLARKVGLPALLERPACGRSGRALKNRAIASRLHLLGELTLRTGGSVDRSLTFYRAARWVDQATLDVEDLTRTGNLSLVPQLDDESLEEIGLAAAGEASERLARLEAAFFGASKRARSR